MVIRKTPKNNKDYIIVDSNASVILHEAGFYPKFISTNNKKYLIYYEKNDDIMKFIQDNNIVALQE